jgi:hypothetical protein
MSRTVELIVGIVSGAMFVCSLVSVVWLVRTLPQDYFVRPPPEHPLPVKIARNVLGAMLIGAGVVMLVLPGQGLITILIGLSVLDLPIKHRLIARILKRPNVLDAVQKMRRKAGKPPLDVPSHA